MSRIRLIWSKLWSLVSAHLVMASCHTEQQSVALYAVDALAGLVQRQLARGELAHFKHQEEALRPFVAVLRHCDEPGVRAATVTQAAQACLLHGHVLGSGWRMLLGLLQRSAEDPATEVVSQTVQSLQVRHVEQ